MCDPTSKMCLEYKELLKTNAADTWKHSFTKELGRLLQAYEDTKGNNTIFFVSWIKLPKNKKTTRISTCCDYRPQKEDPCRTRITVGGNRINYNSDTATPTASITTVKTY